MVAEFASVRHRPESEERGTPRVLLTTSTFPLAADDGLPRFVFDLAVELGSFGQVSVLAPHADGAPRIERQNGVTIHRFRYWWPTRWQRLAYGHGMRDHLRTSFLARMQVVPYFVSQLLALRRLRSREIDVVNSHWIVPQGLCTALLRGRRRRRFRHVLSIHAGDLYLLRRLPWGRAVARFVVARSDAILVDGSEVRRGLEELVGEPLEATVQPMGAHTALFRRAVPPDPADVPFPDGYLLFVGRFTEKKGVPYLLEAFSRVLEDHPGIGLILIGYGEGEASLRDTVNRLGLDRSVLFLGRRGHGEIAGYMRGARVVVVPSIVDRYGEADGMPTVVVEALAAGARVVASRVDGIPDVIRHLDNGWLCREKDPDDIAEKISVALADHSSPAIVASALESAADLDWVKVGEAYSEVFRRVLAQPEVGTGSSAPSRERSQAPSRVAEDP